MIEVDVITLEDGLEYVIIDEIIISDTKYLYLVEENTNNVELRKLNEQEDLVKVEDKNEYQKAMIEFAKKHRNDFTN